MQKDPEAYIVHLRRTLTAAIATYESSLSEAVSQLVDQDGGGQSAVNLLRVIRDSMGPLQSMSTTEDRFEKLQSALPQLHRLIAAEVVSRLSASELMDHAVPSSSSELEDLPSPRTIAFLQRLSSLMLGIGSTDTWSPGAVHAAKEAVASHIFREDQKLLYVETSFDDGYLRIALGLPLPEDRLPSSPQGRVIKEYWSRTKLLFGILAQ